MKKELEKAINDFVNDPEIQEQDTIESQAKRIIKSDNSIIERIDRIIIAENGKQLLREWY